jgi:hypothetical protein
MNKQWYVCIVLFSYTLTQDLSLFDILENNDIDFLRYQFGLLHQETQKSLLTAVNEKYQTPLHYALNIKNFFGATALISLTTDYTLFFASDDEENTPWWLAQELPNNNIFALMQSKIPANFEITQ